MGWLESIEHNRWLSRQTQDLLEHGRAAWAPTGYGYFRPDGSLDTKRPIDLAITARMTFAFSLGVMMGIPGSRRYADHGIQCLQTYFRDPEFDGWYSAIEHEPTADGQGVPWPDGGDTKWQYAQAFLILAAATAANANRPGAYELLKDALDCQLSQWYDEEVGLVADRYTRDWSTCEPYRGMNALMHTVEAYLAAAEVMQDPLWLTRAERMLTFAYAEASRHNWRVPEHHDEHWKPLLDYNREDPNTPHYPYGFVIGHGMELARLGVQLRGALREAGMSEPDILMQGATELFERARVDGWRRGGKPGFVYTVDFEGNPVLTDRLQWVLSEAICATVALRRALLDDGASVGEVEAYEHSYRSWIDYMHDYMMVEPGVIARQLDEDSEPMEGTITARPDIYHTIQAFLMGRVPLWPPVGASLSRGLLDQPEGKPAQTRNRRSRRDEGESKPFFSWRPKSQSSGRYG